MSSNILMPALSPTMTEGKLAKWVKKEGEKVEAGQVIAEIETDKATMEVEAVDDGVIGKILIAEGTENVAVNTPIAILLEEGEELGNTTSAAMAVKDEVKKLDPVKNETIKEPMPEKIEHTNTERMFASPLAKRIARNKGINLAAVQGTGPKGRIVKEDVENFKGAVAAPAKSAAPISQPTSPAAARNSSSVSAIAIADAFGLPYEAVPNTMMRKTIASRLLESKTTVPHYYLTIECNLNKVMALREEINTAANGEYKISVNDFVVKACAVAQMRVPAANVAWADEVTLRYKRPDISVAVATDAGLITPIVKGADAKSLKEVSNEVKALAKKARDGKLKPEEYQGGTMTVSNLGMYGVDVFTAILNPPQCAILAVGAAVEKPIVKDGQIVIATTMVCTASFDHRAIDGAVGAQFLAEFKKLIEETPHLLLM